MIENNVETEVIKEKMPLTAIDLSGMEDAQKETNLDIKELTNVINDFITYEKEKDLLQLQEEEEKALLLEENEQSFNDNRLSFEENILEALSNIDSNMINYNEEFLLLEDSLSELNDSLYISNTSNVEGFYLLAIVITLSMGFKMFFDNVLKW